MPVIGGKPRVKYIPESDTYGKFVVEPLERGYGVTLGNSLRRVLLSSLPGAAITSVKIDGIPHEFSTLSSVTEDVLEIILNLKEIVIKSYSDTPKTITLSSKGKGTLKALDIEHDAEIEIVNPDQYIMTLESGAKVNMEMVVEKGKGYFPAERNKKPNQPIGVIPIDATFSPVKKVNLATEEVRIGQEINYDKLTLEVWTNGSIKADEAVKESAKILMRYIEMFFKLGEKEEEQTDSSLSGVEGDEAILDMSVDDLELSARSSNCLKNAGIKTVRQLIQLTEDELMKVKNFGAKSAKEVKDKIAEFKLGLKGESLSEEEK